MIEIWLILAVTLTVLYLIAMLVAGRGLGKTQSLISALIFGPIAATVATALAFVVHWMVVIEVH
jgi:uncharacterized membrane protein YhdT